MTLLYQMGGPSAEYAAAYKVHIAAMSVYAEAAYKWTKREIDRAAYDAANTTMKAADKVFEKERP